MNNYKINFGALICPGLVWLSGILLIIVFAPRTVYVNGIAGVSFKFLSELSRGGG